MPSTCRANLLRFSSNELRSQGPEHCGSDFSFTELYWPLVREEALLTVKELINA